MKIIAETASNHMGDLDYLKRLSIESKNAGADYITVQIFDLNSFVSKHDTTSHSNFSLIYISPGRWIDYFNWCEVNKINLLPCVLDPLSAKLCYEHGFTEIKIHASDILSAEYLTYCNQLFESVFLEFGGASLDEINSAIELLNNTEVILLYGFNDYPTKHENQNLNFLKTLKYLFNCDVGFAEHSQKDEIIPLLAMAVGAAYLEKHVTLDCGDKTRFDWEVSVEPQYLKQMIDNIHTYHQCMGAKNRIISDNEKRFRKLVYKKIVANHDLNIGDVLSSKDHTLKRSVHGMEASWISDVNGNSLISDISADEPISLDKVKKL